MGEHGHEDEHGLKSQKLQNRVAKFPNTITDTFIYLRIVSLRRPPAATRCRNMEANQRWVLNLPAVSLLEPTSNFAFHTQTSSSLFTIKREKTSFRSIFPLSADPLFSRLASSNRPAGRIALHRLDPKRKRAELFGNSDSLTDAGAGAGVDLGPILLQIEI